MIPENRIPTHPGDILLEEFLKPLKEELLLPRHLSRVSWAGHVGTAARRVVNEIVRDRRAITVGTARLLSQEFGTTEQYWLNLQRQYDLGMVGILRPLKGLQLFYPQSGRDLIVPIRLFAPYISDFWFVDLAYFRSARPADEATPVLKNQEDYSLEDVKIAGPPSAEIEDRWDGSKRYDHLDPCVRTETYVHLRSGERFRVHRRRGYSVSGFHKEITKLGIFFYRGDSDEGSNIPWLEVRNWHRRDETRYRRGRRRVRRQFIFRILNALVDNGLIVTDGSRCEGAHNPYKEFRRFHMKTDIGSEAAELVQDFEDGDGRSFRCVGYAGQRRGPTLIWQVTKTDAFS